MCSINTYISHRIKRNIMFLSDEKASPLVSNSAVKSQSLTTVKLSYLLRCINATKPFSETQEQIEIRK